MPTQTKPSIVFCHGIWADGSCFNKLLPPLQAEGYEVICAQYGLDTNVADVAATIRTFNRVHNRILLIGHSYGGAVITAAGTDDRVAGLVYINALGPDETETSQAEQDNFPKTPAFGQIEVADGRVWMLPGGAACFCGDLPEEEQKVVWATAWPPSVELFKQQRPRRRLADQAELVHRGQKRPGRPPRPRAGRRQAHGRYHLRVRQSHCPMLSQPDNVLDVIRTAADRHLSQHPFWALLADRTGGAQKSKITRRNRWHPSRCSTYPSAATC